jgi:hypothetical protein
MLIILLLFTKIKPCNSAIELTILMMPAMIVGRAFMITEKFMIGCLNKLKNLVNENIVILLLLLSFSFFGYSQKRAIKKVQIKKQVCS